VFFLHNELRRRLGKSLQFVKSVLDCLARFYFFADEKKISRLRMRFASKIFCVVIRARTHFSEGKNDF